jgi:hypothetical protein
MGQFRSLWGLTAIVSIHLDLREYGFRTYCLSVAARVLSQLCRVPVRHNRVFTSLTLPCAWIIFFHRSRCTPLILNSLQF